MHNHDKSLTKILEDASPQSLDDGSAKGGLMALHSEVIGFLAGHYRVGTDLVLPPDEGLGAGMGLLDQYEAGDRVSVVFRHGFRPDTARMMASLLQALQSRFEGRGIEVRAQRFDVRIRRLMGTQTLTLYVRPYLEVAANAYDPLASEEEVHYLEMHDTYSGSPRRCNPLRHARALRRLGPYRDCLELLHVWQHHEGHPVERLVLQLLVLNAATDESAAEAENLTRRMKHVLRYATEVLLDNRALRDAGTGSDWTDFMSPSDKANLADRWRQLLKALQGKDTKLVVSYFRN